MARHRPKRPHYNTSKLTHSNKQTENALSREYFADVEARKMSLAFEPTDHELELADICIRLMQMPREERWTSVYHLVTDQVEGEKRQMQVIRYIVSRLYDAGIEFSRQTSK